MRNIRTTLVAAVTLTGLAVGIAPSLAATTKTVKATKDDHWSPSKLTVRKGDKIRFSWNDTGAPHNVRKASGKGGRLTKNSISNKGSATFTVPKRAKKGAKYRFVCDVHLQTMVTTATVR